MKITLKEIRKDNAEQVDYEKLEKVIVHAITKANKENTQQYSVTREWMKVILYPVFWGIAIISGVLSLSCIYIGAKTAFFSVGSSITEMDFSSFIVGMMVVMVGLVLSGICIATLSSAKEIDKETDRQYIASLFSHMVALVALRVSLIALFRGW